MLIGALNPDYVDVVAIADIRPYNQSPRVPRRRGQPGGPAGADDAFTAGRPRTRPASTSRSTTDEYEDLINDDNVEAVIIALPLWLHDVAAFKAMRAGKHVLCEKLMAQTIAPVQGDGPAGGGVEGRRRQSDHPGGRPSAALQHSVRQRGRPDPPRPAGRPAPHPRPVAPRQPAGQRQLVAAAAVRRWSRKAEWTTLRREGRRRRRSEAEQADARAVQDGRAAHQPQKKYCRRGEGHKPTSPRPRRWPG